MSATESIHGGRAAANGAIFLPYVEPDELIGEALRDPLAFEPRIIQRYSERGIDCSEVDFVTEVMEGEKIRMHAWLARPREAEGDLPPVLAVPGGLGVSDRDFAMWLANTAGVVTLAVDWVGSGGSSDVPGLDPWMNAMRFEGDTYRSSYQFHNVRALVRATNFLLSQPGADRDRLMAVGGSWGGFYSLLLAGVDPRFKHLFVTYGCGFLDTECRQVWESYFASMGAEKAEEWLRAFDPGRRAHLIKADVFYQQATNDKFYSLLATMKTYHRIRTRKRLLLVRNQDHFMKPYGAQDVQMLRHVVEGTEATEVPELAAARWLPGTNAVEVEPVALPPGTRVTVVYSTGTYTKSFARRWLEVPAEERGGRYVAEIPVVDVDREIWFYGHAVRDEPILGASTPVQRIVPADEGLRAPTAEFEPRFDFASEDYWDLPIGDRQHPALQVVEDGGHTALHMQFDGDPSRRGIAYCLEGDLIERGGYNAVELKVRVPSALDIAGLRVCLVTDFHALSEQDYGFELSQLDLDLTQWQTLTLPFSAFRPVQHRRYHFYQPPLRPLDLSRLCGVGLHHPEDSYRGEALIADIRAVRVTDVPTFLSEPDTEPPDPWPLRRATSAELDPPGSLSSPPPPRITEGPRRSVEQPAAAVSGPPTDLHPYDFYVETEMDPKELREHLRRWSPWRLEVIFSNGVRTSELATSDYWYTPHPLATWHIFGPHLPEEVLRGGRALDVGSNIGHYSFFLRKRYGMEVVGLETNPRNVEVANFLRDISRTDGVVFRELDGSTYREDSAYDLILHIATLDHFKNPFLALENAARILKPGGYLALEMQTFKDERDDRLCLFVRPDRSKGQTCWWFLGKQAILDMLEEAGFVDIDVIMEWSSPEAIGETMRRLHVVARRPS